MVIAVWVLAVASDAVLETVAADGVGVGGCDVATVGACSRREVGGQGVPRGAVVRFGSEYRRTRGVGGRFNGGGEAVVTVVDDVDSRDVAVSGCVDVVCCDAAGAVGGRELGMVGLGVVWDELGDSVDVPASLSGRGGSSWDAVCVSVSMVTVAVVWVVALTQMTVSSFFSNSLSFFHFSTFLKPFQKLLPSPLFHSCHVSFLISFESSRLQLVVHFFFAVGYACRACYACSIPCSIR